MAFDLDIFRNQFVRHNCPSYTYTYTYTFGLALAELIK